MAARVLDIGEGRLSKVWNNVVQQVTGEGLALATRLNLKH